MAQAIWAMPAFVDVDAEEYDDAEVVKNPRCYSKFCDSLDTLVERIFDFLPLKQLGPVLILALYTVFGGWLFRHLELSGTSTPVANLSEPAPNGIQLIFGNNNAHKLEIEPNMTDADIRLWTLRKEVNDRVAKIASDRSITAMQKDDRFKAAWAWYDKEIDKSESEPSLEEKWDMWNSMFYAATLYTTIGYGHMAPSTTNGRIATMIYALIGIPLVLTILNTWGDLLFNALKALMRFYRRVVSKFKRRKSIWVTMADMPEGIDDLPVSLAIGLLIFWIGSCAAVFLIWESEWSYFTSLYFFFISLTTIGLGDVVPKYPKYTLMSFILVLIGLSVVSMSFNIIQTKIENVFKSMMQSIEREYWQKQIEPEYSQFGEGGGGVNASVGVMRLWKKKPLRERILFRLMDKSKKRMLNEYWEKKANTKNAETQTCVKNFKDSVLQVDMEEEELQTKYKNRKYIYNLND